MNREKREREIMKVNQCEEFQDLEIKFSVVKSHMQLAIFTW